MYSSIVLPVFTLLYNGSGFPGGSAGKESACSVGGLGSILGLGRSPGEGKGYPLQYSGLENSTDRGYRSWGPKELDTTEQLNTQITWRFSLKLTVAMEVKVKVALSCPTFCNPMDYTVHGILQVRILEWVAFPFSRRSSQPRDQAWVSHIAGGFFTSWATREAQEDWNR